MTLPFLKNFQKKKLPLYYLVLILRDQKAEAVIFEETNGKAKVAGEHQEYFSDTIDNISSDELLETLDKAISNAEEALPENIQTQKTIFGVKESWTENDQIKKEYLFKLKKVSEELGLIPIGFLVISQAISHLLQKEEGVPVSAILIEVNKKNITVNLLRAGKVIETKSSEIHDSVPFTVDTLLKHFNVAEILPSRLIVFNGKEDLSQEFISHTWSKSLPFLHLPQITSLPNGFDARAVLFGAATQMGFEVLEDSVDKSNEEIQEAEVAEDKEKTEVIQNDEKKKEEENFGFLKDVDVAEIPTEEEEKKEDEEKVPTNNDVLTNFSTVEERDYQEINIKKDVSKSPINFTKAFSLFKKISIFILSFIIIGMKRLNFKGFSFAPRRFTFAIAVIVIFAIAIFASYLTLLKATIEITVDPKIAEQNKDILFSTSQESNPSENIIKGDFVTVTQEGSVSTQATGKKDVGTNAKGTVTIFSSLTQNKTLAQGTIIKSPQGLEFTLDQSITIGAVASHSADETVAPAKANVNVTADQLGKESNLPSGTKFTVGVFDASDLIAKNDNPFSGGTKKEVTVASKNDSIKLETDLVKQLQTNAMEELQKQVGNTKILLPKLISENLSSKNFNAKVGEETNQVTLTGSVEYQGLSYDKKDLVSYGKAVLSKDVPDNQEIDYNNIKTTVLDIENNNDEEIKANLNIKAVLMPKIDKNKLTKELKGKSFKEVSDIIYKISREVANVEIKLSPNLPFLPKILPVGNKNINILIKLNG